MLELYGNPFSSPSNKTRYCVSALKLETGLECHHNSVDLSAGEQRSADYLALNPAGRVPCLKDGELILTESGAIILYLARREKSKLYPVDILAQAHVDRWIYYSAQHIAQSMGRVFFNRVIYKFIGGQPDENSLAFGLRMLDADLPHFDEQLKNNDFIAGNTLSLADITLISALDPAELAGVDMSGYANVTAWRKRIMDMDFYKNVHSHFGAEMGM